MKTNKLVIAVFSVLSILILAIGIFFQTAPNKIEALNDSSIAVLEHVPSGKLVELEVARTPLKRQQGLMNVTDLEENKGMFFIFDNLSNLTFWMKNTPLSLDIIFLDQDLRVVNFHKSTIPNQTEILYSSGHPAKYAIELKSGWINGTPISSLDQFFLH